MGARPCMKQLFLGDEATTKRWETFAQLRRDCLLSLTFHSLVIKSQIAELLVEAGGDIDATNSDGKTPLDLAIEGNDPDDIEEMYLIAALRERREKIRFNK